MKQIDVELKITMRKRHGHVVAFIRYQVLVLSGQHVNQHQTLRQKILPSTKLNVTARFILTNFDIQTSDK